MNPARPFRPLRRLLLGALLSAAAGLAQAADGQPIHLLVGFPPGGGSDAIARTLAEKLKDQLGTPVIVDNRAGAGGQIAAQVLKSAPADGHTLFLSHDHTISILPLVMKNPGFDPAADFVPVAGFATFANALALSGGTPAHSLAGYMAWVKQQGGKDDRAHVYSFSRTPGPPPLRATKTTPAPSSAATILARRSSETAAFPVSRRFTERAETSAATAKASCDQFSRARAARI